jgi:hypothetical protein
MAKQKKSNNEVLSWEVMTQEDSNTGDLILPIPPELLSRLGWKEGDQLEWKQDTNGSWILTRK